MKNKHSVLSKRQSLTSNLSDFSSNQIEISDIESIQEFISLMQTGMLIFHFHFNIYIVSLYKIIFIVTGKEYLEIYGNLKVPKFEYIPTKLELKMLILSIIKHDQQLK